MVAGSVALLVGAGVAGFGPLLERRGFVVRLAADASDATNAFVDAAPSVALVDRHVSGADAVELCARLKARSYVPVVLCSESPYDPADAARALRRGADAVVASAVADEVVARVEALLRPRLPVARRAPSAGGAAARALAGLELALVAPEAQRERRPLRLTRAERGVLSALLRRVGTPVGVDELARAVWGEDAAAHRTALKVHAHRIRRKLGSGSNGTFRLVAVRGIGYKLVPTRHDPASCRIEG